LAQFFLIATASVVLTVWYSHRGGYVKLSAGELRAANWYLLCGAYIHFLMDGLVGCYGVWNLMRRAYETLDGRFPKPYTGDAPGYDKAYKIAEGTLVPPPIALRQAIPNFSVPYVVGHMEMLVYFPLCLALYYAYKKGLPWRRPLEILIAAFQLFGAIVFMGAEEVTGMSNLFLPGNTTGSGKVPTDWDVWMYVDTACFYWFAYFFCNLIWVFVPIYLIYKAGAEISSETPVPKTPWIRDHEKSD
jgi:hypothetical protein